MVPQRTIGKLLLLAAGLTWAGIVIAAIEQIYPA